MNTTKKSFIGIGLSISLIGVALLIVSCKNPPFSIVPIPHTTLTATQAKNLAMQLANDKAETQHHCRPFHDGQLPRFESGHWIWTDGCGVGLIDYRATVELAADGSTNSVALSLMPMLGPIELLSIKVVDASTRQPIAGASVTVLLSSGSSEQATDKQGVAQIGYSNGKPNSLKIDVKIEVTMQGYDDSSTHFTGALPNQVEIALSRSHK